MLKTCSVCGKIHDFNKVCRRKTTKKYTEANKFRKTYKWTEKSKYIKQRDNYLCQVCLLDKYNTNYKYTYKELEVHHIIPLEEDYNKRLDSDNLITLCRYHHELAEKGEISREELQKIIADKQTSPRGSRVKKIFFFKTDSPPIFTQFYIFREFFGK